eukprot:TRINITY_DN1959_c0_g1_i1.p1 TRINITY_DN1959_c0_g1~~TRINITY_DN1959_c0_g1_i1.p1  ORF type:complete len:319 (-),score=115.63 TRINITY_DN1959_c0_g1_i1:132-1088(-)
MAVNKMFITMPLMLLLGQSSITSDEDWVNLGRCVFFALLAISVALKTYIKLEITKKNDTREIWVKNPQPFQAQEPFIKTTYFEHEAGQCKQWLTSDIITGLLMAFLTLKLELHAPVFIQLIMIPLTTYEHVLFKLYILKKDLDKAWGESFEKPEVEDGTDNAEPTEDQAISANQRLEEVLVKCWDDAEGYDEVLKCIGAGADINKKTAGDGWTALMILVASGKLSIVKKLIKKGADPLVQDNDGWSSLHWGCIHAGSEDVEKLLGHVVKECSLKVAEELVELTNKEGKTAVECIENEDERKAMEAQIEKCLKDFKSEE